ncbi:hypothetical protein SCHPADRAFT_282666 [Schizopora paradoxa]|uniref:Transposase Tc1-like domain-containing protein n=1 Tax=Schizopora paradoxa TaxID=27342 RepID=A0A0H2RZV7_9AGAM|nr:hypothetical protein SCHPADRAFT_282666 [Schizopora paradoxa]
MARRHIHVETKRVAVRMALSGVDHDEIRQHTLVSPRSTRRAVSLFRRTGELVHMKLNHKRRSDITLEELRDLLESICGVVTTTTNISRSLRRRGYTRKKPDNKASC